MRLQAETGMTLDRIDRRILFLLQQDGAMPIAEVAQKVGLTTTPCWRRIQKLEEDGVRAVLRCSIQPRSMSA